MMGAEKLFSKYKCFGSMSPLSRFYSILLRLQNFQVLAFTDDYISLFGDCGQRPTINRGKKNDAKFQINRAFPVTLLIRRVYLKF